MTKGPRTLGVVLAVLGGACSTAATDRSDAAGHSFRRMLDGNDWTTVNLHTAGVSSYCYEGAESHCRRYGRLYTWELAKPGCQSLGDGWRLPTDAEWQMLAKPHGGLRDDSNDEGKMAFNALFEGGTSGFNAVLGGNRSPDGRYERLDAHGLYWSASESDAGTAWMYNFGRGGLSVSRHRGGDKRMAVSVRCIKVMSGA